MSEEQSVLETSLDAKVKELNGSFSVCRLFLLHQDIYITGIWILRFSNTHCIFLFPLENRGEETVWGMEGILGRVQSSISLHQTKIIWGENEPLKTEPIQCACIFLLHRPVCYIRDLVKSLRIQSTLGHKARLSHHSTVLHGQDFHFFYLLLSLPFAI